MAARRFDRPRPAVRPGGGRICAHVFDGPPSGRRRLRPVLMTSMAAALGMLPLAYGIGSGADMLKPLAVAVIGALSISVLLSLVATPVVYSILDSLIHVRMNLRE